MRIESSGMVLLVFLQKLCSRQAKRVSQTVWWVDIVVEDDNDDKRFAWLQYKRFSLSGEPDTRNYIPFAQFGWFISIMLVEYIVCHRGWLPAPNVETPRRLKITYSW